MSVEAENWPSLKIHATRPRYVTTLMIHSAQTIAGERAQRKLRWPLLPGLLGRLAILATFEAAEVRSGVAAAANIASRRGEVRINIERWRCWLVDVCRLPSILTC